MEDRRIVRRLAVNDIYRRTSDSGGLQGSLSLESLEAVS